MLIIILLVIATAVAGYFLWKRGDQDGDGDVDLKDLKISAEEITEDIKEGVEGAVDTVEEKVENTVQWAKDVADEIKDVIDVIRKKPTKSNLNKLTKSQLVQAAQADHGVELDEKLKKSTLVNKIYSLYN